MVDNLNLKKVALVSQVRMTSTRLPGKVLKEIQGLSLLDYHYQRLQKSGLPLIIATTVNVQDDAVENWCLKNQIPCVRGSENNVLSRYYEAAKKHELDVIIRVTSDCPLIDGDIIAEGLKQYLKSNSDQAYASNVLDRTYPRGFDFEIFSMNQLTEAFKKATDPGDLEHVTPYIHKNRNGRTQFIHIKDTNNFSDWRITVDTPDDFELVRQLIEIHQVHKLNYSEFCEVLKNHPELKSINQHIEQKKV